MDKTTDEQWMQAALHLAAKAETLGEVPVGAVVVVDDHIVGEGWNNPISGKDPTAHAEIIALRSAAKVLDNYRLQGATLYVTIEPCTMCVGAIVHARIDRLVFGAQEPKAGAIISNAQLLDHDYFNHRVDYRAGVEAEACSEMISHFFRHKRAEAKTKKLG